MSKRQLEKERRHRIHLRNRLIVIAAVIVGVLLVFFLLVLPNLKPADVGKINQITPGAHGAQVDKTSLGNPDAPVKMDVWEDFQCSGCLAYSQQIEPQVMQNYVETGKVFYTFHQLPFIDGGAGESHDAANASMCASAQGRFWDYHGTLFANWLGEEVGSFTRPRLKVFAQSLGLDMTAFDQCFQANTYADLIQQDVAAGKALGVPPTPGIFVDGKVVVNNTDSRYIPGYEDIARVIETALAGK
jgi:protein-disulfide isomerase